MISEEKKKRIQHLSFPLGSQRTEMIYQKNIVLPASDFSIEMAS